MNKCSLMSSDCGYWKSSGKDKQVMAPGSGTNLLIGIKKCFLFHQGKTSPQLKTQWVMHQFCLVASFTTPFFLAQVWLGCINIYKHQFFFFLFAVYELDFWSLFKLYICFLAETNDASGRLGCLPCVPKEEESKKSGG